MTRVKNFVGLGVFRSLVMEWGKAADALRNPRVIQTNYLGNPTAMYLNRDGLTIEFN